MTVQNSVVFISANLNTLCEEYNSRRHDLMVVKLYERFRDTITFIPVTSVYKGSDERALMVYLPIDTEFADTVVDFLIQMADYFKQESLLFVDPDDDAILSFLDGREAEKGPWVALPDQVDPDYDSHSVVNGVKYQMGRRLDYPELEGEMFTSASTDIVYIVAGVNYDIGFTAKRKDDPSIQICCIGPLAKEFNNYYGAIEDHNTFFDNCVKAAQTGEYHPLGGDHGSGSVSCAFGS